MLMGDTLERYVAQSVECQTLEVEDRGSKSEHHGPILRETLATSQIILSRRLRHSSTTNCSGVFCSGASISHSTTQRVLLCDNHIVR